MPVVACTTVTPVLGVVEFLAAEFLASYPEFTGINPTLLANDFQGAQLLLNNTCCSRVQDANQRMFLLYLLVAHLATIHQGLNDAGVLAPSFAGTVAITGSVATVSALTSGGLLVGQSLYDGPSIGGSLVVPGSAIIQTFGSGTGGIGTYNLVSAQGTPIAAEPMIVPGVPNVQAPLGIVGRINNAAEGDVSVSSEWSSPPNPSAAYFIQTKYGADYWTYTKRYRTALFVPAPPSAYDPLYGLGRGPWGRNGA
jgi:hypothetical protein